MGSMADNPLAVLEKYFGLELLPPGTPDRDLVDAYRLRFEVFCEECGFMPTSDYPGGLESDHLDATAAHVCARNSKGIVIGTSRLALVKNGDSFPYEAHCQPFSDFSPPPVSESAEVSRLAIHPSYRRRSGDSLSGVNPSDMEGPRTPGTKGPDKRVNAPLLALGMYREMYRYSRENGIRYWYAAMEKPLAKVLSLYGFAFKAIGPEQDYYGPVTPYLGDLRDLETHLDAYNGNLLKWFQHG